MMIQASILLALTIFLILFISIDEILKRSKRNQKLKYKKSWIEYNKILPKNIP